MNSEFLSLSEATRMSGISRPTLRRIIGRGVLEDFRSPADARVRLVKRSDVEALTVPVPRQSISEGRRRQGAAA